MITLGQRLKKLRQNAGLTQKQLEALSGFTEPIRVEQARISRIEHAYIKTPSYVTIQKLAKALKILSSQLLDGNADVSFKPEASQYAKIYHAGIRMIPIISWVQAGAAHIFEELPPDWQDHLPTDAKDDKAFALTIEGDSMEPKIYAGETAIVLPSHRPQNGDIVVANIKKRGVVLKLFHHSGDLEGKSIKLSSYNPAYPHENFREKDFHWIYPVYGIFRKMRR